MTSTSEKLGQILASTTKGVLPSASNPVSNPSSSSGAINANPLTPLTIQQGVQGTSDDAGIAKKKGSNMFTIVIIGLVLVAAILFIFYIWRKRKAARNDKLDEIKRQVESKEKNSNGNGNHNQEEDENIKEEDENKKNEKKIEKKNEKKDPSPEMIEKMRAGLLHSLHSSSSSSSSLSGQDSKNE